jgi:hypothetical protein
MRRAVLLLVLVAACDYPRPDPVGGGDDDVDAATDAAMNDSADTDTDADETDAPPNDGTLPTDARVDAMPIDGMPIDAPGTISVVVTPPTKSTTLGTTSVFTVTITSMGYSGPVTLSSSGGPSDWTRSLTSTVNLSVGQTRMVDFDITIDSNDSAAPAGAALMVTGTISGQAPVSDTSTLTVANEYILPIEGGTGSGAHAWGGLTTLTMRAGARLTIRNDDATQHQIHASSGIAGVIHQTSAMNTGDTYSVVLGSTGTEPIYCHVHGVGSGQFTLVAQ